MAQALVLNESVFRGRNLKVSRHYGGGGPLLLQCAYELYTGNAQTHQPSWYGQPGTRSRPRPGIWPRRPSWRLPWRLSRPRTRLCTLLITSHAHLGRIQRNALGSLKRTRRSAGARQRKRTFSEAYGVEGGSLHRTYHGSLLWSLGWAVLLYVNRPVPATWARWRNGLSDVYYPLYPELKTGS